MPEAPYDLIATLFFMNVALGVVLYAVIRSLTHLETDVREAREELCRHKAALLKAGFTAKDLTPGKEAKYGERRSAGGGSRPGQNGRR